MYLHEFQAKNILQQNKIKCPNGYVLKNLSELNHILNKIKTHKIILKAQIHSGSRKKSGGVKICNKQNSLLEYHINAILQAHI